MSCSHWPLLIRNDSVDINAPHINAPNNNDNLLRFAAHDEQGKTCLSRAVCCKHSHTTPLTRQFDTHVIQNHFWGGPSYMTANARVVKAATPLLLTDDGHQKLLGSYMTHSVLGYGQQTRQHANGR